MKKVKMYFKKLVCGELIGMIRENIGKDVWNNNVHKRCCGMEADDDIDIDVVTAMIIIKASKQGMFDEFDYEMKTEIVEYIVNEFKELLSISSAQQSMVSFRISRTVIIKPFLIARIPVGILKQAMQIINPAAI